jgi:protein CWC15
MRHCANIGFKASNISVVCPPDPKTTINVCDCLVDCRRQYKINVKEAVPTNRSQIIVVVVVFPLWQKMNQEQQQRSTVHIAALPSFTQLKTRQPGQNTAQELQNKDFKKELVNAERVAKGLQPESDHEPDDDDETERKRVIEQALVEDRLSDDEDEAMVGVGEDDSSDDDDSEDDTAELLRELERIKQEKAAKLQTEQERLQQEQERVQEEDVMTGNPLLKLFAVKRRWDEDTVFKNQAKSTDSSSERPEKRFVNDMVRSDFHKKFMNKYIK